MFAICSYIKFHYNGAMAELVTSAPEYVYLSQIVSLNLQRRVAFLYRSFPFVCFKVFSMLCLLFPTYLMSSIVWSVVGFLLLVLYHKRGTFLRIYYDFRLDKSFFHLHYYSFLVTKSALFRSGRDSYGIFIQYQVCIGCLRNPCIH